MSASSESLLSLFVSANSFSVVIASCFFSSSIFVTIYCEKYYSLSKFLGDISRRTPSLDGVPLENHIWATGAAKEI